MTEAACKWKILADGSVRVFGIDAMREIRGLVHGDEDYYWSYPDWPCEWIDVHCYGGGSRERLLEILGESL